MNKMKLTMGSAVCALAFLSVFAREPAQIAGRCREARRLMDKYGFRESESILNEWNYVKGWVDDWVYSLEVERGRFNQKCAAFVAGTMIDCQNAPLDHLMFYDARVAGMNALFDFTTVSSSSVSSPIPSSSSNGECHVQVFSSRCAVGRLSLRAGNVRRRLRRAGLRGEGRRPDA